MSNLARKILFNTFSQVAAKIFLVFIGIFILKILTNYLGLAGYGFYKSIYEFFSLFAIFADLGLYTIGVREMAKNPDQEEKILSNLFTIRTLIICLIIFVAIFISLFMPSFNGPFAINIQHQASFIPSWSIAGWSIFITGIATLLAIMTGSISTSLQYHLKMEWNALGSILGKFVSFVWMFFVVYWFYSHNCMPGQIIDFISPKSTCHVSEMGFYQLLIAGIIGNLVMFATTFWAVRKLCRFRFRFDLDFWRDVVWKSLPYGLALILNQLIFRIGSFSLIFFKTLADVGIYSAPSTILEAAGSIPLYFMNAILPHLSSSIAKNDGRHQQIIQYSFDFLVITSLPLVAGTVILSYQIIGLIAQPEFLSGPHNGFFGSDGVLQILILAIIFSFLNGLFGYILIASNQQKQMLKRNIFATILAVFFSLSLIPIWGVKGAAIGNLLTEIYIALASFYPSRKYVLYRLSLIPLAKIFLSTAIMSTFLITAKLIILDTQNISNIWWIFTLLPFSIARQFSIQYLVTLILLVLFSMLIYFICIYFTKVISKDMLRLLFRKRKSSDIPTEPNLN